MSYNNRYLVKGSTNDLDEFKEYLSSNYPEFNIITNTESYLIVDGNRDIWENIKQHFVETDMKFIPDVIFPIEEEQDDEKISEDLEEYADGCYVDYTLHIIRGKSFDLQKIIEYIPNKYPEFKVLLRYSLKELTTFQIWKDWFLSFITDNLEIYDITVTGGNKEIWKQIEAEFPELTFVPDVLVPIRY